MFDYSVYKMYTCINKLYNKKSIEIVIISKLVQLTNYNYTIVFNIKKYLYFNFFFLISKVGGKVNLFQIILFIQLKFYYTTVVFETVYNLYLPLKILLFTFFFLYNTYLILYVY